MKERESRGGHLVKNKAEEQHNQSQPFSRFRIRLWLDKDQIWNIFCCLFYLELKVNVINGLLWFKSDLHKHWLIFYFGDPSFVQSESEVWSVRVWRLEEGENGLRCYLLAGQAYAFLKLRDEKASAFLDLMRKKEKTHFWNWEKRMHTCFWNWEKRMHWRLCLCRKKERTRFYTN